MYADDDDDVVEMGVRDKRRVRGIGNGHRKESIKNIQMIC